MAIGANQHPQVAFYPNGWHILLRDKEAPLVLNDVISFITQPNTPLPSHADDEAILRLQKTAR